MAIEFDNAVLNVHTQFLLLDIFDKSKLRPDFWIFSDHKKIFDYIDACLQKNATSRLGYIKNVGQGYLKIRDHWYLLYTRIGELVYNMGHTIPLLTPILVTSRKKIESEIIINGDIKRVRGRIQILVYPLGICTLRFKFLINGPVTIDDLIKFLKQRKIFVRYKNKTTDLKSLAVQLKISTVNSLFISDVQEEVQTKLGLFNIALHLGGSKSGILDNEEDMKAIAGLINLESKYHALSMKRVKKLIDRSRFYYEGDIILSGKKVTLAYTPTLFYENVSKNVRKTFRRRFFFGIELAYVVRDLLNRIEEIYDTVISLDISKLPMVVSMAGTILNPYAMSGRNYPIPLLQPTSVRKFFTIQAETLDLFDIYSSKMKTFRDSIKNTATLEILSILHKVINFSTPEFTTPFSDILISKRIILLGEVTSEKDKQEEENAEILRVLDYLTKEYIKDLIKRGDIPESGWRTISAIAKATNIDRDLFYDHKTKKRIGYINALQKQDLIIVSKHTTASSKRITTYVKINVDNELIQYFLTKHRDYIAFHSTKRK